MKKCNQCKSLFEITENDKKFYDKISPVIEGKKLQIPPPLCCPACREKRRLAYRNEHKLYKRKSDLSGKDIVSFFRPNSPFTVYSHDEWWSDNWDPMERGEEFDFNRPFFDQFYKFQLKIPRAPLINNNAVNSDFCNFADGNKNCYLITSSNRSEDCFYNFLSVDDKNVVDSLWSVNNELCYECSDCQKCYNVKYAERSENCVDSAFLLDCKSIQNCFFCIGLRGKQYYIFNQPASVADYAHFIEKIKGSYSEYQKALVKFKEMKKAFPVRRANNFLSSENVSGNNIYNSQNIYCGYDIYDSQDCAYLHDGLNGKDCYDVSFFDGAELCYESTSLIGYGYRFTIYCRDSSDLFYCDSCYSSKNLLGCIGLRNKEYCIFNKQYNKEKYESLYKKIVQYMQQTGEYGEFFPIQNSPFAYNETLAQDYFPINQEVAKQLGYAWTDYEPKITVERTIPADRLPDNIKDIPDDIVNWAIICKNTKKPFRIIKQELKFYRNNQLSIPRLHPDERRRMRIQKRNPRRLFERNCANCGSAILTTYLPNSPEKVWCENCYLKAVY